MIFIILATTFIASSANNVVSVFTALDNFFERAGVPDYWIFFTDKGEVRKFEDFAEKHQYRYITGKMLQVDPKNVSVNDAALEYLLM